MADHITEDDVAQVIRDAADAARALIGGDIERYLELVHHAEGYTLMPPNGGAPVRYDERAESVRASAGFFKSGEASLEHVETHAWGDTVVLVMIERQHGEVGEFPDQDWSLRVTQVYRRDESGWLLVHRHADPLAHGIEFEQVAALARG
jgi:ketosteroid isomerase-like protein